MSDLLIEEAVTEVGPSRHRFEQKAPGVWECAKCDVQVEFEDPGEVERWERSGRHHPVNSTYGAGVYERNQRVWEETRDVIIEHAKEKWLDEYTFLDRVAWRIRHRSWSFEDWAEEHIDDVIQEHKEKQMRVRA